MLGYAEDLMKNEGLSETEAWTRVALGLFSSKSFRTLIKAPPILCPGTGRPLSRLLGCGRAFLCLGCHSAA